MTKEQKAIISSMRDKGVGYGTIARRLGISENTVKSYCRRRVQKKQTVQQDNIEHRCLYCGVPVKQNEGRKEKKFCSDKCRNKWWNSHLDMVDRRAIREITCANCGKTFTVYGNAPRKYCCHECYIEHRFGGIDNE